MTNGLFIVLDGIDGSGTTTHSKLLKEWFISQGKEVILTKEPTEGKIGEIIRYFLSREALLDDPILDALLFAADRQEHQHQISQALKEGKIVISDRYLESSICYQGLKLNREFIEFINKHAIKPDITIILDLPAEVSCNRKTMSEKFERIHILKDVRTCFLKRAREMGHYIVSTSDDIRIVQEKIQDFIQSRLF